MADEWDEGEGAMADARKRKRNEQKQGTVEQTDRQTSQSAVTPTPTSRLCHGHLGELKRRAG